MKKYKKIFIYICVLFILTSCWDKKEIETRSFIIAIGIDKCNNTKNKFKVTMIEPNLNSLQGKNKEENNKYIKVGENTTLSSSINNIDSYSSNKHYLGHTKLIVLSESVLKDKEMFKEVLDTLARNREISKKILILSTKEQANTILSKNIENEPMLGIFVSKFYRNNDNNLGITFKKDLDNLIKDIRIREGTIIPKIEVIEKNVKLSGCSILKNYKLIEWLNDIQTRGYMWVKGSVKEADIVTYLNNIPITLKIDDNKSKLNFYECDNNLIAFIDINVIGSIESYMLAEDSLDKNEKLEKISCMYSKDIKKEIDDTFKIFKDNLVDGFELLEQLKKKNYKLYLKYKDNWNEVYKNIKYNINVSVKIRNIGDIK